MTTTIDLNAELDRHLPEHRTVTSRNGVVRVYATDYHGAEVELGTVTTARDGQAIACLDGYGLVRTGPDRSALYPTPAAAQRVLLRIAAASDYVAMAAESEGEQRAEYGSGAVSLGYDAADALAHYDGYSMSEDRLAVAAQRWLQEVLPPLPAPAPTPVTSDDIPF